jgi:hypothetical protein
LNRLVDLDEISYGGDDIEDDIDSINPVPSTISKWLIFKFPKWAQVLNRMEDLD